MSTYTVNLKDEYIEGLLMVTSTMQQIKPNGKLYNLIYCHNLFNLKQCLNLVFVEFDFENFKWLSFKNKMKCYALLIFFILVYLFKL